MPLRRPRTRCATILERYQSGPSHGSAPGDWTIERILFVQAQPASLDALGRDGSRLVAYAVEMSVGDAYAKRRTAWLRKQLALQEKALRNKPEVWARTRQSILWSIQRMAAGRWVVHSTTVVKQPPTGWELSDQEGIDADLQAWILDMYYRPGDSYGLQSLREPPMGVHPPQY